MGGGFPANYINRTNDLTTYGDEFPEIIIEPGRSLISNARGTGE